MTENTTQFYRHIGVYGITIVDDKLLVIEKLLGPYKGKYDLPGGRLEQWESILNGLKREYLEETGYTVKKIELTCLHIGRQSNI